MTCDCPGPGFCPRYGLTQQQYPWEVCQGLHGTGKQEAYQKKWALPMAAPGPVGLARNAVKAAARVVTAIMNREPVRVPLEVAGERKQICESNVCGFYDGGRQTCRKCGCSLSGRIVNKVDLATERCPVGLWEKYDAAIGDGIPRPAGNEPGPDVGGVQ